MWVTAERSKEIVLGERQSTKAVTVLREGGTPEYPGKEVKRGLEQLYRKVEKHLSEEGNLLQASCVGWDDECEVSLCTRVCWTRAAPPRKTVTQSNTIPDQVALLDRDARTGSSGGPPRLLQLKIIDEMLWTRSSEEFLVECIRVATQACLWDHRSDLYTKKALIF
ncbi:Exocyst complex component 1 [Chionoecetes opilio]|uniref:Exocyst complex component 1 n=1 Tax=Chionoecetes opilio TaxID=41210 RepID=A0A8J5CQN6_CHIOP|nr:Exocyst complex component 1 [Chionoecetes opilio]